MAKKGMTTIQVSSSLLGLLKQRKLAEKESYEEVLLALLEDVTEISEGAKADIAEARREAAAGKLIPLEKVKRDLGDS